MKRKLYLVIPLLLVAAGGGWWYMQKLTRAPHRFKTAAVQVGPFMPTITATGTLQPVDAIDVGAQVVGRIERFGADPRCLQTIHELACSDALPLAVPRLLLASLLPVKPIDYNSPVEKDTLLLQIDTSNYEPDVKQARSKLGQAIEDHEQAKIDLAKMEGDWKRIKKLEETKGTTQEEVETTKRNHLSALSKVKKSLEIIKERKHNLERAEFFLDKTSIRSPVRGIIIDRRVNIGQTVVSSLNAPSLFLIASDLKKLQVFASVNEADIGQVRPGQRVLFTVDTYPDEEFAGVVAEDQPRLNVSMTNNVVTFTVVVNVDNSSMRLKPYLTANLRFVMAQKSAATLVSNTALRWRPQPSHIAPEYRDEFIKQSRQRRPSKDRETEKEASERTIYVLAANNYLRPVRVKIGMTDGNYTEVLEGDLRAGDEVVEGELRQENGGDNNPFISNVFGGGKKGP